MLMIRSTVYKTDEGTPFLGAPGAGLVAMPRVMLENMRDFLEGFEEELGFREYLDDPTELPPGEALAKAAGQLCYMSFGPDRTKNKDAKKYFDNIKASGHGSVIEHPNYTLFFWGISRDDTHELVRHRAGFGFSQVSQRYVDGPLLRFVEAIEFQHSPVLHKRFMERIDRAKLEYDVLAETLQREMHDILKNMPKREARKLVNQTVRKCLPNETEAPIFVTANARGWRHFTDMRADLPAATSIGRMSLGAFNLLSQAAPIIFDDYTQETQEGTGRAYVRGKYRKV